MKTSLRVIAVSFMITMVMGLGTYSRAQDVLPGETPIAPVEAPKAAGKVIPEDITADLNISLYSQYIWRGLELSRDSLVIFPTMTVGYKGFAVNLWADLDTRFANPPPGEDKEFRLWETDVTVTYSNKYEPWKLNYTLGWIYYDTDGPQGVTPSKNQEIFLTLGLDTLLKPTFSVYDEIETGQAQYFNLGISHSFPVYCGWSLDLAGSVSYYINHSTEDFDNFHDGNISAGLKIPLNNFISITPKIQYSFPLSGEASDRIEASSFSGNDDNFVYGGIIFDLAI